MRSYLRFLFAAHGISSAARSVQQHVGGPQVRCRQMGPRVQELPQHRSAGWLASATSQQCLHEGPVVPLDIVEGKKKKKTKQKRKRKDHLIVYN